MRLAILRPAKGYYVGWEGDADHYRRLFGDALDFRVWNDPGDLSGFDLVSPLIAWGYPRDYPMWFALLDREKLRILIGHSNTP